MFSSCIHLYIYLFSEAGRVCYENNINHCIHSSFWNWFGRALLWFLCTCWLIALLWSFSWRHRDALRISLITWMKKSFGWGTSEWGKRDRFHYIPLCLKWSEWPASVIFHLQFSVTCDRSHDRSHWSEQLMCAGWFYALILQEDVLCPTMNLLLLFFFWAVDL